jgi:hypothetical protein
MKKKAQMEALGGIVIALVVIVLVVTIIYLISKANSESILDLKCTQSIDAHVLNIRLNLPPEPINCPTQFIKIKEKNTDTIMRTLARQQTLCWYQWKKGEQDLFPEDEGIFCHMCYVDSFRYKNIEMRDYVNFLRTHRVSDVAKEVSSAEFKDPWLSEYLVPAGTEEFEKLLGDQSETAQKLQSVVINTSQKQAVIFFYVEGESKIHDFAEMLWPTMGVGGVLVGAAGMIGIISAGVATGGVAIAVAGIVTAIVILSKEETVARFAGTTIHPYTEEVLLGLGCEYIPASQEEKT